METQFKSVVILVVVFRKKYVRIFNRILLPSLYKNKIKELNINLEIYTQDKDKKYFKLEKKPKNLKVKFNYFKINNSLSAFENFSQACIQGLKKIKKSKQAVICLNADHSLSDTSLFHLYQIAKIKKHAFINTVRYQLPSLNIKNYQNRKKLHKISKDLLFSRNTISSWPSVLIFKSESTTYIRGFHQHPILLQTELLEIPKQCNSIDGNLLDKIKPHDICYIKDFSKIEVNEFSEKNKKMGFLIRKNKYLNFVKFFLFNCNQNHINAYKTKAPIKIQDSTQIAEISSVEKLIYSFYFISLLFFIKISLIRILSPLKKILDSKKGDEIFISKKNLNNVEVTNYSDYD